MSIDTDGSNLEFDLNNNKKINAAIEETIGTHEQELQRLEAEYKNVGSAAGGAFSQEIGDSGDLTERQQEIYGEITLRQSLVKELQEQSAKLEETANVQTAVSTSLETQLQGINSGLSGLTSGFSAVTNAVSLFSDENENLQKVLTKLQTVMAITMDMQRVAQTLDKNSAFQLTTITNLKEWWRKVVIQATAAETAETVAKKINTAATTEATVKEVLDTGAKTANTVAATAGTVANLGLAGALRLVGTAIKSIPVFGWVIAGISALVNLVSTFASKAREAKKEHEEFSRSITESVSQPVGAIENLAAQWNRLGSDIDAKKKFIDANKQAFAELGVAINDVSEAENLLVTNKQAFIDAQIAKAKAMLLIGSDEYKTQLQESIDARLRKEKEIARMEQAGEEVKFNDNGDLKKGSTKLNRAVIDEKAANKRLEELHNMSLDYVDEYVEKLESANIKSLEDGAPGQTTTGNSGSSAQEDAARQAEKLSKLRAKLDSDAAQAEIDAIQDTFEKRRAQAKRNFEIEKVDIISRREELKNLQGGVLADEQNTQFRSLFDAATAEYTAEINTINKEEQEAILDGFRSFEQEYLKLYSEFQQKRAAAVKAGAGESGLAKADTEFTDNIKNLATDFAESNTEFQSWAEGIRMISEGALEDGAATVIDGAIQHITQLLDFAKERLASIEQGGVNADEAEKYADALARINVLEAQLATLQGKKTVKKEDEAWKKTSETLKKVGDGLEEIGDKIGGTAGEAIKTAGTVANATITMIDGVKSVSGAAVGAMSALEKASVILTIVSAAVKVVTAITGLFKNNDEQLRAAADAAREYAKELREIANAQKYEIFDTIFGANALGKFEYATNTAKDKLKELKKQVDDVRKIGPVRRDTTTVVKAYNNPKIYDYFDADGSITRERLEALKKYAEGLSGVEKEAAEKLIAVGEEYVNAVEIQTEYIQGLFGDLASNIADSMIEAFVATGDAATDMGDIVQNVLTQLAKDVVMKLLMGEDDSIFGKNFQDKVTDLLLDGNYEEAGRVISGAVEEAEGLGPVVNNIFEKFGITPKNAGEVARTATSKSVVQASQDSVDKSFGILTNMDNSLYGISGNVASISEMLRAQMQGYGYTASAITADSPSIMHDSVNTALGHLNAISTNTYELYAMRQDLAVMRQDLQLVRSSSEEIVHNTGQFVRG